MVNPIVKSLIRTQVRQAARDNGMGLLDAIRYSKAVSDSTIEAALNIAGEKTRAKVASVQALGDGTLLNKFLEFLNSELGKALIAIILSLIGI